ncbi:hypothetical protein MTO96_017612 [Rhipicephalus appendiculatus]
MHEKNGYEFLAKTAGASSLRYASDRERPTDRHALRLRQLNEDEDAYRFQRNVQHSKHEPHGDGLAAEPLPDDADRV